MMTKFKNEILFKIIILTVKLILYLHVFVFICLGF